MRIEADDILRSRVFADAEAASDGTKPAPAN
jgi:hypothetical protein